MGFSLMHSSLISVIATDLFYRHTHFQTAVIFNNIVATPNKSASLKSIDAHNAKIEASFIILIMFQHVEDSANVVCSLSKQ